MIKAEIMTGLLCLLIILSGCTRKIYVPLEREHLRTDTIVAHAERVDSVLIRDSVVTAKDGDTIRQEIWRWRERVRLRRDTVVRVFRDTVREERQPEVVAADRETSPLRRAAVRVNDIFRGAMAMLLVIMVICVVKRIKGR